MEDIILKRLKEFIKTNKLIKNGSSIGIAVSGGPDSIFLLHSMYNISQTFNLKLATLHFNHQLRKEAADEELFVEKLSRELNIKFIKDSYNINDFAEKNHLSIEEAARIKRYEFFEKTKNRLNLDCIALAHNKNDVAETVLLNLLRGSTIKGLSSLRIKRGFYIRPVLFLSKDEILGFLHKNNLEYKIDSSNKDTTFKRNSIRLELINTLKTYNPNIVDTLYKEARSFYYDDKALDSIAEKNFIENLVHHSNKKIVLKIENINNRAILMRTVSIAAKKLLDSHYSISFDNIERIVNLSGSKMVVLRKKLKAYIKDNKLFLEKL